MYPHYLRRMDTYLLLHMQLVRADAGLSYTHGLTFQVDAADRTHQYSMLPKTHACRDYGGDSVCPRQDEHRKKLTDQCILGEQESEELSGIHCAYARRPWVIDRTMTTTALRQR